MTSNEIQELASRVRAMSEEEKRIVVDNLPVELMLETINSKYLIMSSKLESISKVFSNQ